MSLDEITSVLVESELGADLSMDQVRALADIMQVRQYSDGEVLVAEGQSQHSLTLLLQGKLSVIMDGSDEVFYQLKPGEFAGAMDFLDRQPRNSTLRAAGPCTVAVLEQAAFEPLIENDPHLSYGLLRNLVRTMNRILLSMNAQFTQMTNYIYRYHGRY